MKALRLNLPVTGSILLAILLLATTPYTAADFTPTETLFVPQVLGQPDPGYTCPVTSTRPFGQGVIYQWEYDDPVRPSDEHADKNIELRYYTLNEDPNLMRELVDYNGVIEPTQPPQFATLFSPAKVPALTNFYQVGGWWWEPSPDPGHFWVWIDVPPVTALGLQTTPGEELHVPSSGYDIGGGMEVMVMYADEDSVALRYTREDSSGAPGYTVHVDKICTDPNLLALYRALDAPDGPRYVYVPPDQRPYGYDLPNLAAGQVFGTASGDEVVVIMVDSGGIMDPRSCNDWWLIRPGYTGTCPIWQVGR